MEPFYVHSEPFWGGYRKWAVFERLPSGGWRTASRFFKSREPAAALCKHMNADWLRYRCAMLDKNHTPSPESSARL